MKVKSVILTLLIAGAVAGCDYVPRPATLEPVYYNFPTRPSKYPVPNASPAKAQPCPVNRAR